ncbi:hypothetical protein KKC13_09340 [bacterium]|nr:hypothetical protein [bacterium]MBU1957823.1 hypothetical protein [bacterium]
MKAILLSIIFSTTAFCDISVVISQNNRLTSVSQQELANLYLKKTTTINGIHVTPIDSKDIKTYQEFYKKVVKKTPSEVHAYWMKQIYTGKTQPPKKLSEEEMSQAMKKNTKIIAYAKNPSSGKILFTIK